MIRALFNNRWFVIVLAVASGLLMVHSIAAPFLTEPEFADSEDPEFYLGEAEEDEAAPETSLVPPGQSVLSGALNWKSEPRRDPFSRGTQPLVAESLALRPASARAGSPLPRLHGLVAGPKSLLAVLDERIVREGDSIGGYRVNTINPDGVRLSAPNGYYWLRVTEMDPAEEERSHGGDPGL